MIGIYCSNAYHGSKAANHVQTINTSIGLAKHLDQLDVVMRGTSIFSHTKSVSSNVDIKIIYGMRGKFGGAIFLVFTVLQLLKTKIKSLLHGKKSFAYLRNIYAGFFTPFLFLDYRAIELHNMPSVLQLRLLKIYLLFNNSKLVVITQALKDDLSIALKKDLDKTCIVVSDSHNATKSYTDNARECREKTINRKIKIAYFGSLNTYKGSELLFEIIRSTDYQIDLYTKDTKSIPDDILRRCYSSYVEHHRIQNIMLDYDVSFLFLNETGLADDVSKYTSPLKLFECLAAGLIVICSDCNVLKEVVNDSNVIFVKNDIKSIVEELSSLTVDKERRKKLSKAAINASLKYTYESRATKILHFLKT